ncbi:hypothetical protein C8Q76DRAFT_792149 [Earliella scabrosa]|nr:hypothetical protein C8Q76DRAFT_792149 [Earliella scabrosa]
MKATKAGSHPPENHAGAPSSMTIQRQQLEFVRVFKVSTANLPHFKTILMQRYEGVDGVDLPLLAREWTLGGAELKCSNTVREIRKGRDVPLWAHYDLHYKIDSSGLLSQGLAALVTSTELPVTYAEFVVVRRSSDTKRIIDVRSTDRAELEALVLS